jgi:hypothetical protein
MPSRSDWLFVARYIALRADVQALWSYWARTWLPAEESGLRATQGSGLKVTCHHPPSAAAAAFELLRAISAANQGSRKKCQLAPKNTFYL